MNPTATEPQPPCSRSSTPFGDEPAVPPRAAEPDSLPAPAHWAASCVHTECTFHQLSPYIGKLKSTIAHDLIEEYTRPGDLVVDPFAGSGTVPLEAMLLGRTIFASDISPYSEILVKAKISPPATLDHALQQAEKALFNANTLPPLPDDQVPNWVKAFFHPQTLQEVIRFANYCRGARDYFSLACLLGILHHQRPGFLSHPCSHLVPYLRSKKFPPANYPALYTYRPLAPRLFAKIKRAYKRWPDVKAATTGHFRRSRIENLKMPNRFDCLITSPPYMNALDYTRDNRLRLWFLDPSAASLIESQAAKKRADLRKAIVALGRKVNDRIKHGGYCILVVGAEASRDTQGRHPKQTILDIFLKEAPSMQLETEIVDKIPDIRRSRRDCRGTKREFILIFRKE